MLKLNIQQLNVCAIDRGSSVDVIPFDFGTCCSALCYRHADGVADSFQLFFRHCLGVVLSDEGDL